MKCEARLRRSPSPTLRACPRMRTPCQDGTSTGYSSSGVKISHMLSISVSTPDEIYVYAEYIRSTPDKVEVYAEHMHWN